MPQYNGNIEEYWEQTKQEYEEDLQQIYMDAAKTAEQADVQINSVLDEMRGHGQSNIEKQRSFNQQIDDAILAARQKMSEHMSETEQEVQRNMGILYQVKQYRARARQSSGSTTLDRENLERLYNSSDF